jgi:hypothetical protein
MALARIREPGLVSAGGYLSLETDGRPPPPPNGFTIEAERRFGKAHILLLRRAV